MISEYQHILERFRRNRKSYLAILKELGQLNHKTCDALMSDLDEKAFEEIDCLQCANCCRGTGPLLKSKDIDRLAKSCRQSVGAFMQNYIRNDEDGDFVFQQMPCPFLESDNYCNVYSERPEACSEYPHSRMRHFNSYMPMHIKNLSICPALVRMLELYKD